MKEILIVTLFIVMVVGLLVGSYYIPKLMKQYSYTNEGWNWNYFSKTLAGLIVAVGSFVILMLLPT